MGLKAKEAKQAPKRKRILPSSLELTKGMGENQNYHPLDTLAIAFTRATEASERNEIYNTIWGELKVLLGSYSSRFYARSWEASDFLQISHMALLEALKRYDPARGRFKTFAQLTVRKRLACVLKKLLRAKRNAHLIALDKIPTQRGGYDTLAAVLPDPYDAFSDYDNLEEAETRVKKVRELQLSPLERAVVDAKLNDPDASYDELAKAISTEKRSYGSKAIDNAYQRIKSRVKSTEPTQPTVVKHCPKTRRRNLKRHGVFPVGGAFAVRVMRQGEKLFISYPTEREATTMRDEILRRLESGENLKEIKKSL